MRAALALLAVLLVPGLTGCLGASEEEEGPRLAQPTDVEPTITPPASEGLPNGTAGAPPVNSSAGYEMEGDWSVGDAWYYKTSKAPQRDLFREVIAIVERNNRTFFVLDEVIRESGQEAPLSAGRVLVDTLEYARVSSENQDGTRTTYDPALPMRYYRNGTFSYTFIVTEDRLTTVREKNVVNSYYGGIDTIPLPWGPSTAGRIEHRHVITDSYGTERRVLMQYWLDRTYLAPVAIETDGQLYTLVAAQVGERTWGTLPSS